MRLPSLFVAVALLLSPAPASAALQACTSTAEQQAMQVRSFQSYLMVAGVACNQAAAYNKFMNRYQSFISGHGNNLKSYFTRAYGANSATKMNGLITDLANAWSQIHMKNMNSYCKATWDTFWYLDQEPAATAPAKLLSYAQTTTAPQSMVVGTLCSNNGMSAPTSVAQAKPAPSTSSKQR